MFASATNLDRNSGVAKRRDLLCAYPPNQGPTSELANPAPAILFIPSEAEGSAVRPGPQTKALRVSSPTPPHSVYLFRNGGWVQAFELTLMPIRVGRRNFAGRV